MLCKTIQFNNLDKSINAQDINVAELCKEHISQTQMFGNIYRIIHKLLKK